MNLSFGPKLVTQLNLAFGPKHDRPFQPGLYFDTPYYGPDYGRRRKSDGSDGVPPSSWRDEETYAPSSEACRSTRKSRKKWLEAMSSENGFQLRELLRKEPCLLTVIFKDCNVLHLAVRKGWYGLVWEILRCFDHVLYAVGEVAVDPFANSAARSGDGHPLHSAQTSAQVTYASGNDGDAHGSGSTSASDKTTELRKKKKKKGQKDLKTIAEASENSNSSRHNCLNLTRFRELLIAKEGGAASVRMDKFYSSQLDVFGMLVVGGNIPIHVIIQEAYSRGMKQGLFEKGHPYGDGPSQSRYRNGIMRATKRRNQREEDNQTEGQATEEHMALLRKEGHRALLRSIFETMFGNDERREASTARKLAAENSAAWELESPFLPFEEYLFFSVCRHSVSGHRAALFQAIKEKAQNVDFLEYLFTISGPCGTVFHFTEEECFKDDLLHVFKLMPIETQAKCLLIKDTRGRTPFFRACELFTDFCRGTEGLTTDPPWLQLLSPTSIGEAVLQEEMTVDDDVHWAFGGWDCHVAVDLRTVSCENGYAEELRRKRKPVEEIICIPFIVEQRTDMLSCFKSVLQMVYGILKKVEISPDGKYILPDGARDRLPSSVSFLGLDGRYILPGWARDRLPSSVSFLGLTVLLSKRSILEILLKDGRFYDDGRLNRKEYDPSSEGRVSLIDKEETWCASVLHLAAMQGDPDVIRQVLTTKEYSFHITDIPLISEVNPLWISESESVSERESYGGLESYVAEIDDREKASEGRRQGCINLLLGAGLDIWDTNKDGEIANPGSETSLGYSTWWYEKLERETQQSNARLSTAATAVSVTGALVATASFIGPLQPPLGYGGHDQAAGLIDKMQVGMLSVRMFIVSNTLAFYFALGAIMLSLTPSLPVPQESVLDELKLTRRTVTVALVSLILSLTAILVAFAASSIAVIPDEGSWNHGGLTVSTLVIGGLWCTLILLVCIMRAVRLIFHRSQSLRLVYRRWVYR